MINLKIWQPVINACVARGLSERGVIHLMNECKDLTLKEFELIIADLTRGL